VNTVPFSVTGGGMHMGGGSGGSMLNLMLTDQNYQQIQRAVAPNKAIPIHSTSEHMRVGVGSDDIVATIYGLPTDKAKDLLPDLESGDYSNGNSGCLVGSTFATDHNVNVGSRISIGQDGQYGTLRVTGIIPERGMSFDISTDSAIVVTKDWFENTYNDKDEYNEVVVKVTSGDTADVKTTIEGQLNRNTKNKIVSVIDSKATLATIYATFGTITTFVTAIGGISMVVAGVSIFNIMMMSVNERIKEIGIMRSIDTQKKEVMSMFIYEAAIIRVTGSLIGGILSVLAGYGISAFMLKTTKYLFSVASMLSVVEGVTFGIIICIACGLYPAWKAANLNPIDALRHE